MVGPADRGRAGRAGPPGLRGDGGPLAGPAGSEPAPLARRRRRTAADHGQDRGPLPRPHGPPRRQEGRPDPRRRRLAGPRPRTAPSTAPPTGPRPPAPVPGTCTCTPRSTGTPGWPTPSTCPTRPRKTAIGFWARARAFFAAHGITTITRVVTDNGAATARLRSPAPSPTPAGTNGPARSRRSTTARWRVTSGSSPRSCSTPDRSPQKPNARHAIEVWNIHYNYHRPHTAAGNQPPAHRLDSGVTNVMRSYS